jgi:hypothetical protein
MRVRVIKSITKELLIDRGYKEFVSGYERNTEEYVASYQKRFDDNQGIKYFITFDMYDFSCIRSDLGISFTCKVQFNTRDDNKPTFDVSYLVEVDTKIEDVEKFFDMMWVNMKCGYYELF